MFPPNFFAPVFYAAVYFPVGGSIVPPITSLPPWQIGLNVGISL